MASEGKVFGFSPSHSHARQIQTMISEETQTKTSPYISKTFPQNIPPVYPRESLGPTGDFQQNRHGMLPTSSVSTQPAAMPVGPSSNHPPCHIRTPLEETRPKAIAKFPANFYPHNTRITAAEETLRKGIFANSKSSETRVSSPQNQTTAIGPPQHYHTAVSPPQHYHTAVSPPQHYHTAVSPTQHHATAVSPPQHHATAVSYPQHHTTAEPPEGSPTAPDIPPGPRKRLLRCDSMQVGDHNDVYKIDQMTDFKGAKINKVVIHNNYHHCNNSKSDGLHKYIKTESDSRIEVANRHCCTNGLGGSTAVDGSGSGRSQSGDLDQDSCGPAKRHKADLTETSYTKSDCWQELPDRNHISIGVSVSSANGGNHGSVDSDDVHSQIQRSCGSFVRHSSYEKHELTSDGGRITLQKCSQSIICITDSVKIFDSDGEMVREGDVLYIDREGGYYGVYIGDGLVTFVDVDGQVTTKTVQGNLTIPIATEAFDASARYRRLQPLSRVETSQRAKDLIGRFYPGSGEDLAWLCRYGVPGVPS